MVLGLNVPHGKIAHFERGGIVLKEATKDDLRLIAAAVEKRRMRATELLTPLVVPPGYVACHVGGKITHMPDSNFNGKDKAFSKAFTRPELPPSNPIEETEWSGPSPEEFDILHSVTLGKAAKP